jgi:hypothetical protein
MIPRQGRKTRFSWGPEGLLPCTKWWCVAALLKRAGTYRFAFARRTPDSDVRTPDHYAAATYPLLDFLLSWVVTFFFLNPLIDFRGFQ